MCEVDIDVDKWDEVIVYCIDVYEVGVEFVAIFGFIMCDSIRLGLYLN